MYKVILVEDELLVRVGLERAVPWEKYDMKIVASVVDGEEAYLQYQKTGAQVIITDIRVPRMNGMELLERIRANDKQAMFIILTCLADFKYAQEAIALRSEAYIVKSELEIDEFCGVLEGIKHKLDALCGSDVKKAESADAADWASGAQNSDAWLSGRGGNVPSAISALKGNCFQLCMIDVPGAPGAEDVLRQLVLNQKNAALISVGAAAAIVYAYDEPPKGQQQIVRIQALMQTYFNIELKIRVSPLYCEIIHTPQIYRLLLDQNSISMPENESLRIAMSYIDANLSGDISLTRVAVQVHLSEGYLRQLFSNELNMSFTDYITGRRLDRAKALLVTTDDKLYDIAERVGFSDPSYFNKVFKRAMGLTPQGYREKWNSDKK